MKHNPSKKKVVRPLTGEANKTLQIAICLFLAIATFAVYWQVLDHEFLNYDDKEYVTNNWNVKAGLTPESIKWAFTTGHFANWHPMTWFSHMLDFQLYGSQPKGHLLTNLLIHTANALLLFIVLRHMTGALWQSGFVAALFALHPFNVESVAWVAERKNVLSTLFWVLTIWSYVRFVEKPSPKRYGLTALFLTLGLMSKPMLVTLPIVLLMLDFWPLGRWRFLPESEKNNNSVVKFSKLLRGKIPFFVIAVGSCIITFIVQKGGGALKTMEDNSLLARIANAMVSYVTYLGKTFWPSELSVFYPHPGNIIPAWQAFICVTLLAGISFFAVQKMRKAPYLAFGWFWFLGTLVPVIQIVQTGAHAMADRYAYVPIIGLFIMVAWGLPDLLARWNHREKAPVIFTGLLIPLMFVTWNQVGHWKDSITLFKHAISVTDNKYPDIALTHNNLGIAQEEKGRLSEAIAQYKTAMKIRPDFALPHNNLGNVLFATKKTEEAIAYYKSALKLNPAYAMAHSNLGIALEEKGELEEAIAHYREAIRLEPNLVLAHYNLGIVLKEKGEFEEAISHYKAAIKFKPDFALAHINLGNALLAIQKTDEAITHYRFAIKINPNHALAHNNLKIALFQSETR
jgi:tetratricopeptide (TPR) repeat protein